MFKDLFQLGTVETARHGRPDERDENIGERLRIIPPDIVPVEPQELLLVEDGAAFPGPVQR